VSELEAASASTLGAWDTIFGFTAVNVTGRDMIDLHDLFASLGLSFSSSSAAFSGGYLGVVSGFSISGVASNALFVDTNGGGGFGDGDDFWVAGLAGVTGGSAALMPSVIV
jgi:hypothetical protein